MLMALGFDAKVFLFSSSLVNPLQDPHCGLRTRFAEKAASDSEEKLWAWLLNGIFSNPKIGFLESP